MNLFCNPITAVLLSAFEEDASNGRCTVSTTARHTDVRIRCFMMDSGLEDERNQPE